MGEALRKRLRAEQVKKCVNNLRPSVRCCLHSHQNVRKSQPPHFGFLPFEVLMVSEWLNKKSDDVLIRRCIHLPLAAIFHFLALDPARPMMNHI
jgi:hypothetical protein